MEPEGSGAIARFASRGALFYYVLLLPAFVAEAVFSLSVASSPGGFVALNSPYGPLVADVVQVLPFAFLAASVYAVFTFRPSVLVTLMTLSFLLAVSVANGASLLGVRLDLAVSVILVVASAFLALAGFNFARGLKLSGERRPVIEASGSLVYTAASLLLELAVPLGAAVGLVLVVQAAVAALELQVTSLPQPLSTLASLYLQSRIGLISTTLFVAGATIWIIRQSIEPLILHFTLTPTDAKRELLSEIEPTTKSTRKVARYKPSGGLAWGFLTAAYCTGVAIAIVYFLPRADLSRDLSAILSFKAPPPTRFDVLLENAFQNAITRADILFAQSQDYIREIARLLWG